MATNTCKYDAAADLRIQGCQLELWQNGIRYCAWNIEGAVVHQKLGPDCYVIELETTKPCEKSTILVDVNNALTMDEVIDAACNQATINLDNLTIEDIETASIAPTPYCTANCEPIFVCKVHESGGGNTFELLYLPDGSETLTAYSEAVHGPRQLCSSCEEPSNDCYFASSVGEANPAFDSFNSFCVTKKEECCEVICTVTSTDGDVNTFTLPEGIKEYCSAECKCCLFSSISLSLPAGADPSCLDNVCIFVQRCA